MSPEEPSHLFGPVPSRRLGRSLGVDPVPFKMCTFDCVYCQLGRTTALTTQREPYVSADTLIGELQAWLDAGGTADIITLSGSGEPTLNAEVGEVIAWLKRHAEIPVGVLTNGSLLWQDEVRRDVAQADLLIPSLDAARAPEFTRVNRPCPGLELPQIVEGLVAARRDCSGELWLEVMLVAGYNDSDEDLQALRETIERIDPGRVQINTVLRPPAEQDARPLSAEGLVLAQEALGAKAEIVAPLDGSALGEDGPQGTLDDVRALLRRRPCTLADVAAGLGVHRNEAAKYVAKLAADDEISAVARDGQIYYGARPQP